MEISEKDWKLFKAKLPEWQEKYMERLCRKYTALLSSGDAPSKKFWALEKQIRNDKKSPGICADMRRSELINNIYLLIKDKVITQEDLSDFSRDLQELFANVH